ncbi:hypothetical protein SAMN05421747_102260 [Parapedobacter composti]|uniref:LiaI-LiaF-like transmembrane region domain-containing protein n=1 Tax=Parapedobacter composti TaxID=623281 RepID=A0A1I1F6M7_9SPHI|nr:DUF5668 domain-containing protein [Parapedobacter composti]SFB94612.1 hypothetical protein SAMN05421747_102260 [Parapedobacter composti]
MNKEKLSWGLILLVVGAVLLLDNLDIINFYWRSVFSMWPVILIVIGINLLMPKQGIGNAVSVVVTIAALAFVAYRGTFPPHSNWWSFNYEEKSTEHREDGRRYEIASKGMFTHDYDPSIAVAKLNIKGGAVEYEIGGSVPQLFHAETSSAIGSHVLETNQSGDTMNLNFFMKSNKNGKWQLKGNENKANIRLNSNPVWHIALDMGAGSAEFDLTEYKVGSLRFNGGAASFEARLGMPLEETIVNAESGVASIAIEIPKAAACRIVVKSGLSSKDFPGFSKQNDGSYVTDGYEQADQRFVINLHGGLSSFSVTRYD